MSVRNILFIMCDQLRWDYLSCTGHESLHTPNIDKLAEQGVRFNRAYVQSPICGSSRMSFYTGRYVHSHGASWNGIPLKVSETTLGDHMRELGRDAILVGKTHMRPDLKGMERLGIEADSVYGVRVAECGFDPFERDDGLHGLGPRGRYDPQVPRYNDYLRELGYGGENPWHSWANSVEDENGEIRSGFMLKYNGYPCRLPEEHTETPYMTRRAIEFMEQAGSEPWCLHLSYIKPHWPCVAPAPYHDMYSVEDIQPVVRTERERLDPHPVYKGFMEHGVSKAFSQDEIREIVIPPYMGLIKQLDDQLGVVLDYLDSSGLAEHTMICFTSDHGDYLGDHWMGEKDLFHEPSVRIPLILYDPRPSADATRGRVSEALVESIDLVPTFIDACGGSEMPGELEGRSLMPFIERTQITEWREYVFSEYDYTVTPTGAKLGQSATDSRLFMVFDGRWKYIHAIGYRPMLFDLLEDPNELVDLGSGNQYADVKERMHKALSDWGLRFGARTTRSDKQMEAMRGISRYKGILVGVTEECELPDDIREHLRKTL